jgi:C4-dicarboxylate-specific signal transduction histidine kinase
LKSSFSTIALGEGSSIALFRTDGTLLVRYPRIESAVGQSYDGVLKVIENKSRGNVRLVGRMDNKDRILSVHRLENFPVAVSVGIDVDTALADWRRDARIVGGAAFLFVLVVLATILLGVRQIRSHELLTQARADQAEAEKARAIAEAELLKKERLSVLGQLTATVAHELRNPLSAIRNTLPVLRALASGEREELFQQLARIERSIKRCDRLVASLLEYTKERELMSRPVLFDDWLDEVLDEQTLPIDISLERNLRAGKALVMLDTQRFQRVVINLIENATQAISQHDKKLAERKLSVSTNVTDHVS